MFPRGGPDSKPRCPPPNTRGQHALATSLPSSSPFPLLHSPNPFSPVPRAPSSLLHHHLLPTELNSPPSPREHRGLGAEICRQFAAAGANIAINYFNDAAAAEALAAELPSLSAAPAPAPVRAVALRADASSTAACASLVTDAAAALGGPLAVVVANAGWTRVSAFGDLDALSEADWDRCWAANVKSPLALLRAALPGFRALHERGEGGGVFLLTSSVSGVATGGSSMAYSVTKAAQLHLMKCLAATQGPGVRVNAVLPGLLLTDWGLGLGEERVAESKRRAVLGRETKLEDCAAAYVMLAKNESMTGAKVQVGEWLFPCLLGGHLLADFVVTCTLLSLAARGPSSGVCFSIRLLTCFARLRRHIARQTPVWLFSRPETVYLPRREFVAKAAICGSGSDRVDARRASCTSCSQYPHRRAPANKNVTILLSPNPKSLPLLSGPLSLLLT